MQRTKLIRTLLVAGCLSGTLPASAQPTIVTNVRDFCQVLDATIPTNLKLMSTASLDAYRETDPAKKRQLEQVAQSLTNGQREAEERWARLGCAQIIYGSK